ncbi:hypothetical protein GEMRC1_012838 [Eukaryota sp. GEM-RC1]
MDLHSYLDEQLNKHGVPKECAPRRKKPTTTSTSSSKTPTHNALENLPVVPSATVRSAAARALGRELDLLKTKAGELTASLHPSSFSYPSSYSPSRSLHRYTDLSDASDCESISSTSSTASTSSRRRRTRKKKKATSTSSKKATWTTFREMTLQREVQILQRKLKQMESESTKSRQLIRENSQLREAVQRLEGIRLQQRALIKQLRTDIDSLSGCCSMSVKKVTRKKKKR